MNGKLPAALGALLLLVWAGLFGALGRRSDEPAASPARPPLPATHTVTPQQLTASGSLAARPLGSFTAPAHDGRRVAWPDFAADRPAVVVFVKQGCPCNAEFEPAFRRLHAAYGKRVRFAAVIDADVAAARRYAEAGRVPYPVLADPGREVIARFGAANGASVALVTPPGHLDTLWPGCSADMLRDLGRRLADLAGVDEQPLDTSGLPTALTGGCPFALAR